VAKAHHERVGISARGNLGASPFHGTPVGCYGEFVIYRSSAYRPPSTDWLVDGMLKQRSHVTLFAPSESFKSFVAVDLACSVAAGAGFHGRKTDGGNVLYVAAEAPEEVKRRIDAWRSFHGIDADPIILPMPIQTKEPDDMGHLRDMVTDHAVKLVVLDTLSRCACGVRDNESVEVNQYINIPVSDLVRRSGATVMLVHHSGHKEGRERGSSAFRDAVDTAVRVVRHGDGLTLSCAKQRSAQPFSNVSLTTVPFGGTLVLAGGSAPREAEEDRTAEASRYGRKPKRRLGRKRITNAERIIAILEGHPDGLTWKALASLADMPNASFDFALKRLRADERVRTEGGRLYAI
jgi:hypothetical protein